MKLKKVVIWTGIAFMILVLVLLPLPIIFINPLIVTGVEKVGPMMAKVDTKLESASISLFSGHGTLKGLHVGNPAGYKTPFALRVGEVSLGVKPGSLLSDKVVVTHARLINPEITFEGDLRENNLGKIVANLQAATGGSSGSTGQVSQAGPSKKLQVDKIVIAGAKVNAQASAASGGQSMTLTLPDIEINGLGQGPEGITPADLTAVIIREISGRTATAVVAEAGKRGAAMANQALETGKAAAQEKSNKAIDNATKGLTNRLKLN